MTVTHKNTTVSSEEKWFRKGVGGTSEGDVFDFLGSDVKWGEGLDLRWKEPLPLENGTGRKEAITPPPAKPLLKLWVVTRPRCLCGISSQMLE